VERLPRDAGPVLEAMCGSGRLLLPLVAQQFNLHGVDRSAAMLASCEARLELADLKAPLYRQDVVALNLPCRYAAALVAAGSFQLITSSADARAALERLRAHLVDPGLLLLDLFVPAEAAHPPGAPVVEVRGANLSDGARISLRSEVFVDAERKRIDTVSRYERRERGAIVAREDERLAMTWYDEDEIVALVGDAGYRSVTIERSAIPAAAVEERRFAVSARA
jgi:cyclopropane fatty-acyl-phospholipid synthase-like methyltransferase